MNPLFLLSPHYQDILSKIRSYSANRVPLLLLGSRGSRKGKFLQEALGSLDYKFTVMDCEIFRNREIFYKEWEDALESRTILLLSIQHLSKELQSILNKELVSLKEKKELPWVLSTSSSDIRDQVSKKYFIEDLYFRIGVVSLQIEPIHKRKKEILILCQYLLEFYTKKYKKRLKYFDDELSEFLVKFDFPGDLDQLEALMENLVILGKGRTISYKDLPRTIFEDSRIHSDRKIRIVPGIPLFEYEKEIIKENLRINSGNRERTAENLKISVRTLYRKIDEYDLKDLDF